jgi:hypothetical protein
MSDTEFRMREAQRQASADLSKGLEQLLAEVHAESYRITDPHQTGLANTLVKFAGLVAALSLTLAEATRVQRRLKMLAWLLVLLVALQSGLAIWQLRTGVVPSSTTTTVEGHGGSTR